MLPTEIVLNDYNHFEIPIQWLQRSNNTSKKLQACCIPGNWSLLLTIHIAKSGYARRKTFRQRLHGTKLDVTWHTRRPSSKSQGYFNTCPRKFMWVLNITSDGKKKASSWLTNIQLEHTESHSSKDTFSVMDTPGWKPYEYRPLG